MKNPKHNPIKPTRPFAYNKVHKLLQLIKGQSANSLSKKTYLASSTISKLRKDPKAGGTRWPRADTLDELYRLVGWELQPVPIKAATRPKKGHKQAAQVIPFFRKAG